MSLIELRLELPPGTAADCDTVLLEEGADRWSVWEDVGAGQSWLLGIFESAKAAEASWARLQPLLPFTLTDRPVARELADADWRDSYKAHFQATQFGQLHWVPEWERESYSLPRGERVIWLDPGLAFGTGNHETTRLCAERLVEQADLWARSGKGLGQCSLVDAGCGSGILALSAVRLGFGNVVAFDLDPEAIAVSEQNAELNGLGGRVAFHVADLQAGLAGSAADLVLANIQADVLVAFAAELLAAVKPGGRLVLSGILAREREFVQKALGERAPEWIVDSRTRGEWSDLVLDRPA